MAVSDTTRLPAEYRALTEGSGLLDRSERGKLALSGSGAKQFLAGQVSNDTEALSPGTGCYAAFLTPKGKMLGDLRILDRGEELLLDTERVALQALFDMIRRFKIGYDVELHKRTLEYALLSLIGPASRATAARAFASAKGEAAGHVLALPVLEHESVGLEIDGVRTVLVGTDVGLDIFCDASARGACSEMLLSAGAEPVSEQAAEIRRVESGRPRYGADLDETVIPQEAGLNERAVSFTKGCYVGQETVARLYYRGKPNRHLRGLRLSEHVESTAELRLGERVVGRLSSPVLSPAYGPIGLALVRREAEPGTILAVTETGHGTVSGSEGSISAEVIELPFSPRGSFE